MCITLRETAENGQTAESGRDDAVLTLVCIALPISRFLADSGTPLAGWVCIARVSIDLRFAVPSAVAAGSARRC